MKDANEKNAHAAGTTDAQANSNNADNIVSQDATDASNSIDDTAVSSSKIEDAPQGTIDPVLLAAVFEDKSKKLLHDMFGDLLIQQCHVVHIDTATAPLAIWDSEAKCYRIGDDAVRRYGIAANIGALKSVQKREVLEYLNDRAPVMQEAAGTLIAFKNGVLDYTTGRLMDPTPDLLITNIIPHEFDPDIDTSEMQSILNVYACNDETVALNLAEIIGVCMTRAPFSQCAVLIGTGANGKSTYIQMLKNVIGKDNYASLDVHRFDERFQLVQIAGKLANFVDDTSSDRINSAALAEFKKSVTGEEVYTDIKNGAGYFFKPYATTVLSANEFPRLGDSSFGMQRRLQPVPFEHVFEIEDRDPDIIEKIASEDACRQLIKIGVCALAGLGGRDEFTPSKYSAEMIEEIMEDSDTVRQWVNDEAIGREDIYNVQVPVAYSKYMKYCEANGIQHCVAVPKFSHRIMQLFPVRSEPRKVPFTGKSVRTFVPTGAVQVREI